MNNTLTNNNLRKKDLLRKRLAKAVGEPLLYIAEVQALLLRLNHYFSSSNLKDRLLKKTVKAKDYGISAREEYGFPSNNVCLYRISDVWQLVLTYQKQHLIELPATISNIGQLLKQKKQVPPNGSFSGKLMKRIKLTTRE